ncbi:hypothetical protein EIP91_010473 [Steccherinum ochraceum]|uniref:AB hydrolase-1 domain-containing protein n=1 Tax=Steccherinum ochraceum TaxID=92696 RepID=A0A4R0RWY2_9APHY|nr:hypothetical protein EIP91_010473 [Steccherinum ochraceum]
MDQRRVIRRKAWLFVAIVTTACVVPALVLWEFLSKFERAFWIRLSPGESTANESQGGAEAYGRGDLMTADGFDWYKLKPSTSLKWTSCYDGAFDCTRLSVPLDYSDPAVGNAAVAIIRYPSPIPRDQEGYKGPLLLNPGGPGQEGVLFARMVAKPFRAVLGDGFDLIGFDPRGVGLTTPALNIFESQGEAALFELQAHEVFNFSTSSLGTAYANMQNFGQMMAERERVANATRYIGTPAVARDMLRIVEAHGQEKLQYWGFSYGTVLGATFSAMFPDKVGRVILDGVVDAEDYYKGLWLDMVPDTDEGLRFLEQECVDLGPSGCAFYEPTVDLVHARLTALLAKLRAYPISFYDDDLGAFGLMDYSSVKRFLFQILYGPIGLASYIFQGLYELEQGKVGRSIIQWGGAGLNRAISTPCQCSKPETYRSSFEAVIAIACGDGEPFNGTVVDIEADYREMAKLSSFAECLGMRLACSGWKLRAKERFTGNFSPLSLQQYTACSHYPDQSPVLTPMNVLDPVTPLWNARKMSRGFKDSVLLTQDSPGHCSLAGASLCTTQAIRSYFKDGVLPKPGTVCDIIRTPAKDTSLNIEDQALLDAAIEMQHNYPLPIPMYPF